MMDWNKPQARLRWLAPLLFAALACADPLISEPPVPAAVKLGSAINAARQDAGLQPVPWSPALALVAQEHVWDLERNTPVEPCNLHSWSTSARWEGCCYQASAPDVACMTTKPRELAQYSGRGYEIAVEVIGSHPITPERAMELWMASPEHRAVILSTGEWEDVPWEAMGAAITEHYAVVWFGDTPE